MAQDVAETALLAAALAVVVIAVIGALALPSTPDRVHVIGPVSVAAPVFVTAALLLREGLSPLGIKALLCTVVLWIATPVLSHATMRAIVLRGRRLRERGRLPGIDT